MASPDVSPSFEYHLTIYGCTKAKSCVLLNTGSCPMNQEVVVGSSVAPRRMRRNERIDPKNIQSFHEAVQGVGLTRRISIRPTESSLAQDAVSGRENDQFQCDKVGGERGNVYINKL